MTHHVDIASTVNTNAISDVESVDFAFEIGSTINLSITDPIAQIDLTYLIDSFVNTSVIGRFSTPRPAILTAFASVVNVSDISNVIVEFPTVTYNGFTNQSIVTGFDYISYTTIKDVASCVNQSQVALPTFIATENVARFGQQSRNSNTPYRQKKTFFFSDLGFDFLAHPLTGDVGLVYDVDAINQSLSNIINTNKFERHYEDYDIASKVRSFLFEMADGYTDLEIKNEIFSSIVNHEPRISIVDIVSKRTDPHAVQIVIYYKIKRTETVREFKTLLKRT